MSGHLRLKLIFFLDCNLELLLKLVCFFFLSLQLVSLLLLFMGNWKKSSLLKAFFVSNLWSTQVYSIYVCLKKCIQKEKYTITSVDIEICYLFFNIIITVSMQLVRGVNYFMPSRESLPLAPSSTSPPPYESRSFFVALVMWCLEISCIRQTSFVRMLFLFLIDIFCFF